MNIWTYMCALLVAAILQGSQGVEPGWTPLFNGKDFTGWKISNPEVRKELFAHVPRPATAPATGTLSQSASTKVKVQR